MCTALENRTGMIKCAPAAKDGIPTLTASQTSPSGGSGEIKNLKDRLPWIMSFRPYQLGKLGRYRLQRFPCCGLNAWIVVPKQRQQGANRRLADHKSKGRFGKIGADRVGFSNKA